jgi:hypothetical protein
MDFLVAPDTPASADIPPLYLTRHGGIRLITRTRLNEDELLQLLNDTQRVLVARGGVRKPRLYLIYSLPDADFFVVAVSRRTGAIITVLPLRMYECRIPGKPRIVPVKDLFCARGRALSLQGRGEALKQGAIVRLKMIFRRREGNLSREWREAFQVDLAGESTPIGNVDTEKALLEYPGFLEKMSSALSACADSWGNVYRMYAEIQDLAVSDSSRRNIDMPWTCLTIEQAADPKACERFPALQGLAVDDDEESFDRYACPMLDVSEDQLPCHALPVAMNAESALAYA